MDSWFPSLWNYSSPFTLGSLERVNISNLMITLREFIYKINKMLLVH